MTELRPYQADIVEGCRAAVGSFPYPGRTVADIDALAAFARAFDAVAYVAFVVGTSRQSRAA